MYSPQTNGAASLSCECKLALGLNEWQNLQERKLSFGLRNWKNNWSAWPQLTLLFSLLLINWSNIIDNITVSLVLFRVFSLFLFILTQLLFINFFLVAALNMVQIFCLGICIHRSTELTFRGAYMNHESWECNFISVSDSRSPQYIVKYDLTNDWESVFNFIFSF